MQVGLCGQKKEEEKVGRGGGVTINETLQIVWSGSIKGNK